jgi:aryl-alcohol dehydrogenase-like predicted oxidoreductase/enamine deaminase RidA (YjgF/YER057c/UK114 family)
MSRRPSRIFLAPGLEISRIVTGLWQLADMERQGPPLEAFKIAAEMKAYADSGFDTFDVADHYGNAEDHAGDFYDLMRNAGASLPAILTKWYPEPGPVSREAVRAAVIRAHSRLQTRRIDLMQFHWWMYHHPGWIDAMKELSVLQKEGAIGHLGTTNFDTDHLRLLHHHGIPIVSNQVSFSLLDRRAANDMTAFCLSSGTRLLAYGTLAGGLLTGKWHGKAEPRPDEVTDWSTQKYLRFVKEAGGWDVLQSILDALAQIAGQHRVSIANVALRWALEQRAVAAVIVGVRLGENDHREDNLRIFDFELTDQDYALIDAALVAAKPIRGDCGDEYRRPPYLTASGDLSSHVRQWPAVFRAAPVAGREGRLRLDTGSIWEPVAGYSRAFRAHERILVSGTTATHGSGEVIAPGSAQSQAVYALDKIRASIEALGGTLEDVVRTRIYLRDIKDWEEVSRVHGRVLGHVRPANTLIEVSGLVGGYEVEIEAEAIIG